MSNRDEIKPVNSGPSQPPGITPLDRRMANICRDCLLCRHARKRQAGAVFWLVKHIEERLCPFCRAYARVYGRKAHQR